MTVIRFHTLTDKTGGRLPLTLKGAKTRAVERAFGLPPSRYFFAGRANPSFGDCALVYRPAIEDTHNGSANPFDTGGVYDGHAHPFRGTDEADRHSRGRKLVEATKVDLKSWRSQFAAFLDAAFDTPPGYFHAAPSRRVPWGPPDLPAWDDGNATGPALDWRAWTWEVRLHEEHDVPVHLERWGCLPGVQKLLDDACTSGSLLPLSSSTDWLAQLLGVEATVSPSFCDEINADIRGRYA